MEKNKIVGIGIISLIAIILIILVNVTKLADIPDNKMILQLKNMSGNSLENGYIFKDNDTLGKYTSEIVFTQNNFKKYNYALIKVNYDSCEEKNINLTDYKITGNDIEVEIEYERTTEYDYKRNCKNNDYKYYLIQVNKKIKKANISFNNTIRNDVNNYQRVEKKPIIYLYPEQTTQVEIKLLNDELLTSSYPKYEKSWNVTAYKDGKLVDNKTGRKLYGLYWEGNNHNGKVKEDGFIVEGKDTIEFLEEKLSDLGLNEYESEEFIIYWLPQLEKNKYNYIRFETEDEINNYMPIEVTPKPDTSIRIVMDYKPLNEKINVKEQTLSTKERKGFTLVEWGGVEIN